MDFGKDILEKLRTHQFLFEELELLLLEAVLDATAESFFDESELLEFESLEFEPL